MFMTCNTLKREAEKDLNTRLGFSYVTMLQQCQNQTIFFQYKNPQVDVRRLEHTVDTRLQHSNITGTERGFQIIFSLSLAGHYKALLRMVGV